MKNVAGVVVAPDSSSVLAALEDWQANPNRTLNSILLGSSATRPSRLGGHSHTLTSSLRAQGRVFPAGPLQP
jgi:hypothetical protein